jgi:hypothetical protein
MEEKTLARLVVLCFLILCFVHVKIGEYIHRKLLNTKYYKFSNKRIDGWILVLIPTFILIKLFAFEHASVIVPLYIFLSMSWGVLYFDYIAKDKDTK